MDITDAYIAIAVTSDYARLTLFTYSLLGVVRRLLDFEPPKSITT